MEIDLSPLQPFIEKLFNGLVNLLFIPFLFALIVGLVLLAFKVHEKVALIVAIVVLLLGIYIQVVRIL